MTRADVARLLGRAGFGATYAELDEWTGKKYADLVDKLLDVPPVLDGRWADEPRRLMHENSLHYGTSLAKAEDEVRAWWLDRMRTTPWPLLERMTLLWHGHFATAIRWELGISAELLVQQNQTLRRNALGNFRTLVEEITVDPAMLLWLNGAQSRTPHPNENYAREFFELFTLGKRPQVYTERDIREAARAFTGWTVLFGAWRVSRFDSTAHDSGDKRILGTKIGNLGAEEYKKVVEIALKEPVAPRFIAAKLVTEFAYASGTQNLLASRDKLVNAVASKLRSESWDLKAAMRTLLLSDEFRYANPRTRRHLVRQPAHVAVAACRALGIPAHDGHLQDPLRRMGQALFEPPNVGGWPVGTDWFTPISSIARYDLGLTIYDVRRKNPPTAPGDPGLPQPGDLAGWARRLGVAGWSANTTRSVNRFLSRRKGATVQENQAGVLALLVASPDFGVM